MLPAKKKRHKRLIFTKFATKIKTEMSNIRITKKFFETGHALYGYDGKCKMFTDIVINCNRYRSPIENRDNVKFGMVIDFTDLKKKKEIVDQFDHATVFNETTPHVELAHELRTEVIMLFW
jgi:6-pyruvoyltetrahydropterin/6-carboxytetrahydropterin synthase